MKFNVYGAKQNESKPKSDVDWSSLNNYTVETCGLQEPETLIGVVAGIVDLGTQEQQDSEVVFTGTAADEAAEIAKNPNTYFKDGRDPNTKKPARLKCWPNKAIQSVAVAVDFPEILLDKSQFFGEDGGEAKPLRLWLGDSRYIEGVGSVVARPTPLKVVNIDKEAPKPKWSFSPLHLFYKMAVGAKIIKPGDVFLPEQIGDLLGKAFQFQTQIFFRQGNDGKDYYTEKIKFVGGLGRGQKAPENPNAPFVVQFFEQNSEEAIKNLRHHIITTIKQAKNYPGSAIQKQLIELGKDDGKTTQPVSAAPAPAPAPVRTPSKPVAAKPAKTAVAPPAPDFEGDDDVPF